MISFDFKNLDSTQLEAHYRDIVTSITECNDRIVNCSEPRTFLNTHQPSITTEALLEPKINSFGYAKEFYTSEHTRNTASKLHCELEKFLIDQSQRKDVYHAYISYDYESEKDSLTYEERRSYEQRIKSFKREGLHLEGAPRDTFIALQKKLTELKSQYNQNMTEENTSFEFSRGDLDGLPDSWFTEKRLISDNIYKMTLKYPDYVPAMEYVRNREVRKKLCLAYGNRCMPQNGEIFEKVIKLRYQLAKLLGYANHADFATELKIVKNGSTATAFIENLNTLFTDLYRKDVSEVYEFAQNYHPNPLHDVCLRDWDEPYYNRLFKEASCSIDMEELKQYFPLSVVREGIFNIYQQLLGLRFTRVNTDNKWHDSVELFSVHDSSDSSASSDSPMGYFYLDMFPREGKYSHAAAFDFQNPCDLSKITGESKRRPTIMAMICNFPEEGCISFSDVETFFHEFGHVMHQICSLPQLPQFCGFGVEYDFVEAPSQMLENWCYSAEALKLMSGHKDTGQPIPSELITKLKTMQRVLAGKSNKRQFVFGLFDLRAHSLTFDNNESFDPRQLWYDVVKEVCEYDLSGEDINRYASFGHLMSGYDASYYGYMRAKTYSANMFHAVFKENPLSPEAGMKYRKKLLEPGSTKDGLDLLQDFLGCPPDDKYFLEDQGL